MIFIPPGETNTEIGREIDDAHETEMTVDEVETEILGRGVTILARETVD